MYVILDGAATYRIDGWLFKPGATEVPDDDPVIPKLRAAKHPRVRVQETRDPESVVLEPEPEPTPPPYEVFKGRDAGWYFLTPSGKQSDRFDSEGEAEKEASLEQRRIPLAADHAASSKEAPLRGGKTTLADVLPPERIPCSQGCGRTFRNRLSERNHVRIMHPEPQPE